MKKEPFEEEDGYRVWLSTNEQQELIGKYEEEPQKQLAIELMLDGLRSDEVRRVSTSNIRKMDTDDEGYMLVVEEGKTGYRECPISQDTVQKCRMIKNVRGVSKDEPLVDVSKRTIQRYVTRAADSLSDEQSDWKHVTAHDLRRTWATHTYWRLSGSRAKDVIMCWGGWSDVQTFSSNYLGAIPDEIAIGVMKEADLD